MIVVFFVVRRISLVCSSSSRERTCALIVGGLPLQSQAVDLKYRPDIVICTPGRMIDHLHNTMSVDLDDVEVVILDEADRLMDLGFVDEVGFLLVIDG